MKIVKVIGGLGNQMFQYSFFNYLKNRNVEAKIDISGFDTYDLHNGLEINKVFDLIKHEDLATQSEIKLYKDNYPFFKVRKIISRILSNYSILIKKSHWIEPRYSHYYKDIEGIDKEYLEGYWQNENYLKCQEKKIKSLFCWKKVGDRNEEISKLMQKENSVSIHIRRLDSPKNLRQILFVLKLRLVWRLANRKYYLNAIDYVKKKINRPKFYIFTDNIEWVKRNIPLDSDFVIIDWNRQENSHLDMYLMTQCKHNIISMSSFSWWGAWLNNNPGKLVIAPQKWALKMSPKDEIIPSEWIRL